MTSRRFTKKAEAQLRGAGWCPGRCIFASGNCSESQGANHVLREFGQLSLRSGKSEVLEFGPDFEIGPETNIPDRVISASDASLANAVWDVAAEVTGFPICNVAWELGQDEHAIGVDHNGLVYSATWRIDRASQVADADVMKLADSMNAYLNYWLVPGNETRRSLHATCPTWYEQVTVPLTDI